ncbi:MAG: hypothetical protein HKN50_11250 [Gammaproteobacteria bacterium]|nr:hypothetical protein [Gammaproteobacteria bacterium]
MRRLLLVRHAKSSWKFPELSDHDRPLNKRGRRDVPRMAAYLAKRNEPLDAIYSSSAVRALAYATQLAEACEVPLIETSELYTFSAEKLLSFARNLPESQQGVALVSHNPATEIAIEQLSGQTFNKVPTGAIAAFDYAAPHWQQLAPQQCQLDYFMAPKLLP